MLNFYFVFGNDFLKYEQSNLSAAIKYFIIRIFNFPFFSSIHFLSINWLRTTSRTKGNRFHYPDVIFIASEDTERINRSLTP